MQKSDGTPDEPVGDGAQLPDDGQALDDSNAPDAEMAHVLFLDVVGYSQVPTDVQGALMDRLQKVVQEAKEFRRAHTKQELIALPTGDGMALVFMQDPAAPVRCALEIAARLKDHPAIPVRMGVNSGPIFRRTDITGNVNVSGAGIDYAQRAMDRGDAGHILLTKATAGYLSYLGA